VDYADSMCVLQRKFGSGEAAVYLGFRPGLFSEHMRVVLMRQGSDRSTRWGIGEMSFDGGRPMKVPYTEGWVEKQHVRVALIDLSVSDLAPLNHAKQFRIQVSGADIVVAPEQVEAAMKALDPCQKDLLISWGMDKATLDSIVTYAEPKGGVVGLFTSNDYPTAAMRKNEQGTAGVRYWVSKEGKVRDCAVVESSGSAVLDAQTCAIISKRGTFLPARTKTGEAVESIGFSRVHWILPSG
jgi:TonB family protein